MAKMYSVTIRNRAAGIALAVAIVGVGAVLLTVGFALLASLAVVGGVVGAGYALYHRLRGTSRTLPRSSSHAEHSLDPMLEVKPKSPAVVRPVDQTRDPDEPSQ